MNNETDKLPENEVDDSHDSIEVTDLGKWITPQPKPTTDEEEEQNHSRSVVEVELSCEYSIVERLQYRDRVVCKEWFAGLQSI